MKILLDSIDPEQIEYYSKHNIIDGVTTNPSLMSNSKSSLIDTIKSITSATKKDVSIEVVSTNYENMIKEGSNILSISDNIVIKLPCNYDGFKACTYFAKQNIGVNMTLCFSINQAMLAAKSGAKYISPFIGRMEDNGQNGIELIKNIRQLYNNYNYKTFLLAASIRNQFHIEQSALIGADAITLPEKLLKNMSYHHLTLKGMEQFTNDWKKSKLDMMV